MAELRRVYTITCGQALPGVTTDGDLVVIDEPGAAVDIHDGAVVQVAAGGCVVITASVGARWTVTRYAEYPCVARRDEWVHTPTGPKRMGTP